MSKRRYRAAALAWLVCFGCPSVPQHSLEPGADGGERGHPDGGQDGGEALVDNTDAGLADGGGQPELAPEHRPYDPSFDFYLPIAAGAAIDPRSEAIVAQLAENARARRITMAALREVPSVYLVDPELGSDYRVSFGSHALRWRLAGHEQAGGGSDYPIVLLDRLHPDYGAYAELRLWQANIDHAQKQITASGGGVFHYNNDGESLNPDGTPSLSIPFLGWGTGCGLSYLAGLLRPQEVATGELRHALRFAYSNCHSSNDFRPPAIRTDQPKGCALYSAENPYQDRPELMDMGMRLRLDPGVDCGARTVPGKPDSSGETRFLRMVCRALQRYGMIMSDGTANQGLMFYMEDSLTAQWEALLGPPQDIAPYQSYGWIVRDLHTARDFITDGIGRTGTDGIPWERLSVLAPQTP